MNTNHMLKRTTIGIIGYGFVGKALHNGLAKKIPDLRFKIFDVKGMVGAPDNLFDVATYSDYIFVCVPTPTNFSTLKQDLSIVRKVVRDIVPFTNDTNKVIVIKTTTLPGTTHDLAIEHPYSQFVFNPEFLTEAHFMEDFLNQTRIVLGGYEGARERVRRLYFKGWPKAEYYLVSHTEAELIKYGANCCMAVKVAFFNEINEICERMGANFDQVRRGIVSDKRIGPSHSAVPGPDGLKGFGGKCFPKDLLALIGEARDELMLNLHVMPGAWETNIDVREHNDWEDIEGATSTK